MSYVDGFLIPIPKKNLNAYLKMARLGKKIWKKHGALDYKECVLDDVQEQCGIPFPKLAKTKSRETVIFAYILFKSRAHRDRVNAKVMKEMENFGNMGMPFDIKRMSYGGFNVIVG